MLAGINVTEKDIVEEYNKNKDRAYTRKERKGKDTVSKVMPLSEVRDRIKYMLVNKEKSQKRRDWENELLKKNEFKINEDELVGE